MIKNHTPIQLLKKVLRVDNIMFESSTDIAKGTTYDVALHNAETMNKNMEQIIVDHEIMTLNFSQTMEQSFKFTKVCPQYLFRITAVQDDEYRFVVTMRNKTIHFPWTRGITCIGDDTMKTIKINYTHGFDLYANHLQTNQQYLRIPQSNPSNIFSIEVMPLRTEVRSFLGK